MSFNLTESPWNNAGRQYSVRVRFFSTTALCGTHPVCSLIFQDLWTHTDNGTAVRNFTAKAVPEHGVVALLLRDAGPEPAGTQPPCARPEGCIDRNGTEV